MFGIGFLCGCDRSNRSRASMAERVGERCAPHRQERTAGHERDDDRHRRPTWPGSRNGSAQWRRPRQIHGTGRARSLNVRDVLSNRGRAGSPDPFSGDHQGSPHLNGLMFRLNATALDPKIVGREFGADACRCITSIAMSHRCRARKAWHPATLTKL